MNLDGSIVSLRTIASHGSHSSLADGINTVADKFPEKYLMAGVNGLFNDREDVFGVDLNLTLFVQHRHDNNVKT